MPSWHSTSVNDANGFRYSFWSSVDNEAGVLRVCTAFMVVNYRLLHLAYSETTDTKRSRSAYSLSASQSCFW